MLVRIKQSVTGGFLVTVNFTFQGKKMKTEIGKKMYSATFRLTFEKKKSQLNQTQTFKT